MTHHKNIAPCPGSARASRASDRALAVGTNARQRASPLILVTAGVRRIRATKTDAMNYINSRKPSVAGRAVLCAPPPANGSFLVFLAGAHGLSRHSQATAEVTCPTFPFIGRLKHSATQFKWSPYLPEATFKTQISVFPGPTPSNLVKASQGKIFKPTAQSPVNEPLTTIPEKQDVPDAITLTHQAVATNKTNRICSKEAESRIENPRHAFAAANI